MKGRRKNLVSKSTRDKHHSDNNKIELLACKFDGHNCKSQLAEINKNFSDSTNHFQQKNYIESIKTLEVAFDSTFELKEQCCIKCAALFRGTIIQSLENIHNDLKTMTSGFWRSKSYESSYLMAGNLLNNFRKNS